MGFLTNNERIRAISYNHTCLKKFCDDNDIIQFLCLRHYQESFGSNSLLGEFVNILLFTYSLDEFEIEQNYSIVIILEYLRKRNIDKCHLSRFADYTGVLFKKNDENEVEVQRISNPMISKLCLWEKDGVPTCKNHVESLHLKVNKKVYGKLGLFFDMKCIFNVILKRVDILHVKNGRNFFITR